jgi:hypothetical protein
MKPGLLMAVPNQSDFIKSDLCRMSTAIIPGAISEATTRQSQYQSKKMMLQLQQAPSARPGATSRIR